MTTLRGVFSMRTGDNIYKREDGRFEARYIKDRKPDGKAVYGSCYGKTHEEARRKRERVLCKRYAEEHEPQGLNLLILGAGSHGQEVYEIAQQLRVFNVITFLDDDEKKIEAFGPLSSIETLRDKYSVAIVAIGDENVRQLYFAQLTELGYAIPTLIHPSAIVASNAEIGVGTVVMPRAVISPGAKVGKGCIISTTAVIDRSAIVPDWTFVDIGGVIKKIGK